MWKGGPLMTPAVPDWLNKVPSVTSFHSILLHRSYLRVPRETGLAWVGPRNTGPHSTDSELKLMNLVSSQSRNWFVSLPKTIISFWERAVYHLPTSIPRLSDSSQALLVGSIPMSALVKFLFYADMSATFLGLYLNFMTLSSFSKRSWHCSDIFQLLLLYIVNTPGSNTSHPLYTCKHPQDPAQPAHCTFVNTPRIQHDPPIVRL